MCAILLVLTAWPVRAATEVQARKVTGWSFMTWGYRVSGDTDSFTSVDGDEFVAGETESAFESDTPPLLPFSDVPGQQWRKTASCTNHTDCVDDPWYASDGNATIINSGGNPSSDIFNMQDLDSGFAGWTVDSVTAHVVARSNLTGVIQLPYTLSIPDGPSCSASTSLTEAFTLYSSFYPTCNGTPWNISAVNSLFFIVSCQSILCINLITVSSIGIQVNVSLTTYSLRLSLTVGEIVPTTASFTNNVTLLNASWLCTDALNTYNLQLWNGTAYNTVQTDMCAASSTALTNADIHENSVRFRILDPTGFAGYPNGTLTMDWFTVFLEAEGISGNDLGWIILFVFAAAFLLFIAYLFHRFKNQKGGGV